MYKRIIEDLKLDQIEESGQCFRFVKTDNPAYLTDARNDVYKTIYKCLTKCGMSTLIWRLIILQLKIVWTVMICI